MKKSVIKKLICVILVMTTAAIVPMQALAATVKVGKTKYVSELMIASNKDANTAKNELTSKGFTVIDNNLNDGVTRGGAGVETTYLGYKTTTNIDEAITDLRIMDMNGGYSVNDYQTTLNKYEDQILSRVRGFQDVLAEFRENYFAKNADGSAKNKNTEFAYQQMNKLVEDDSGKKIGDILIDDTDNSLITKIVMQANSDALQAIELFLAIGCTDNWLKRIQDNSGTDYSSAEAAASLGEFTSILSKKWGSFSSGLIKYYNQLGTEDGYDLSKYDEKTYSTWASGRSDKEKSDLLTYGGLYLILDKYKFDNRKLSEIFRDSNPKNEVYYMIAHAMTIGQLKTLEFNTLETATAFATVSPEEFAQYYNNNRGVIEQAAIDEANSEQEPDAKQYTIADIPETASIYSGVDRSLFANDGSVALTDASLRKKSTKDMSFNEFFKTGSKGRLAILGMLSFLTFVSGAITYASYLGYKSAATELLKMSAFTTLKGWAIGTGVFVAIDLIILGVTLGSSLKDYYNPDYSRIPRVIVDHQTIDTYDERGNLISRTDDNYIAYYAVSDAEAQGNELKFGDLNGWSAKQWNALYYTKNKTAGNPIKADFVIQRGRYSVPSGYSPLEYFGENRIAFDINTHAFGSRSSAYIFYAEDRVASVIASSFSIGFIAIAAFGGLVIGAVISYFVFKKRFRRINTETAVA